MRRLVLYQPEAIPRLALTPALFSIILSPMNPLNLYSALLLVLLILVIAGRYLLRRRPSRGRILAFALLAVALIGGWFALRPMQTPHDAAAALRGQLGAGTPVLLEFQSPY